MADNHGLTFARTGMDFSTTVQRRVNEYFRQNNINRHGNSEMVWKSVFMFTLYFAPYALILSGVITNPWALLIPLVIMGVGLAGIGLSVMHDANHGAYSNKSWVNTLMGYSINLIGANAFAWKIQHNVL
ncbi:MAG TPA: fatty acid desaturase, partial [Chryseosolibacter sp.]|nr:fatty acid desaturase [Chryseosolibacter sp.]